MYSRLGLLANDYCYTARAPGHYIRPIARGGVHSCVGPITAWHIVVAAVGACCGCNGGRREEGFSSNKKQDDVRIAYVPGAVMHKTK